MKHCMAMCYNTRTWHGHGMAMDVNGVDNVDTPRTVAEADDGYDGDGRTGACG